MAEVVVNYGEGQFGKYREQLAGFLVRAHDVEAALDDIFVPDYYCAGGDPSYNSQTKAVQKLRADYKKLQAEYDQFKKGYQALASRPQLLTGFNLAVDDPSQAKFWQGSDNEIAGPSAKFDAKNAELSKTRTVNCDENPQTASPPPPPPPPQPVQDYLKGLTRPGPSTVVIPHPEKFCSEEEKKAALKTAYDARWQAGQELRDGPMSYAIELSYRIQDAYAKGMNRDEAQIAALEAEKKWADADAAAKKKISDEATAEAERIRTMPVVNCNAQAHPLHGAGGATDGPSDAGACPPDKKVGMGPLSPWQIGGGYLAGGFGQTNTDLTSYLGERSVANPNLFRENFFKPKADGDFEEIRGGIVLGGPIVRDRLWFFGAGFASQKAQYRHFEDVVQTQPNDGLFIPGTGDIFSPYGDGFTIATPGVTVFDLHYRKDVKTDMGYVKAMQSCYSDCENSINSFGGLAFTNTRTNEEFGFVVPSANVDAFYATVTNAHVYSAFGGLEWERALGRDVYMRASGYLSLDLLSANGQDSLLLNGLPQYVPLSESNTSIGGGLNLSLGYQIDPHVGIEIGASYANHETGVRVERQMDPSLSGFSRYESTRQEDTAFVIRATIR
jgi:hypothetical protein